VSRRNKKQQGSTSNGRPSLFKQIHDDMRRNPPSAWKWKNQSIWPYILGFVALVLWKMMRYR
jgi:hypothetical protein